MQINTPIISMGWECPRCHRILSPMTSECPCYLERGLTNTIPQTPLQDSLWDNITLCAAQDTKVTAE